MSAKTPANKADERERMRAHGFVLRQVWVHEQDLERFGKTSSAYGSGAGITKKISRRAKHVRLQRLVMAHNRRTR